VSVNTNNFCLILFIKPPTPSSPENKKQEHHEKLCNENKKKKRKKEICFHPTISSIIFICSQIFLIISFPFHQNEGKNWMFFIAYDNYYEVSAKMLVC
jgi:hypothetical protein